MKHAIQTRTPLRVELLERVVAESRAEIGSMTLDRNRLEEQLLDLQQQLWEARLRWQRARLETAQPEIDAIEDRIETHIATIDVLAMRIDRSKVRLHRTLEELADLRGVPVIDGVV